MQINNQVNLNKFSLNISTVSKSALKFNQGEILKGQVEEIKGNGLISINLKGEIIEALSTVEVNKGQELYLTVDNIKNGKAILKILTPKILSKMENSNLSNTLKEMNLPNHVKNLQMAKKLVQHKLPLTAENMKTISKGINLLNGPSPKNLELVGLAMAKDLPINSQTLESLFQFVEGESNMASLTEEVVSLMDQAEGSVGNSQFKASNDSFKLLEDIIETIRLPVDQNSTSDSTNEITESIKTNLNNKEDLVKGMDLVKNILKEKEIPQASKNIVNTLINKIDETEKELIGQNLLNVISKVSDNKDFPFYYLSFPVKFENEYRMSQIKISKGSGKKSLRDMDNIRFVVSLDTRNLGLVLFHVDWRKSEGLKIEGLVENELSLKYIEKNIGKLIENLESLNYRVGYNGIKISENINKDMSLKLEEKTEEIRPFQIDIRV